MSLKNWIYGMIVGLTLAFGVSAKQEYQIQPPVVPAQTITNQLSGIWVPLNPASPTSVIGLSLTVISGKYFIPAQWGLPNTCGNYLNLKASVPKFNPNTTIAGEREVSDPSSPISFGTEFLMRIPGRPGIATYVRFDSYDAATDRLTVTFSQNSTGFNGQLVMARYLQVYYPSPLECHL